jgi:hypothetical protein
MLVKRKGKDADQPIELGSGYLRSVLRVADAKAVSDRLAAAGYTVSPMHSFGSYRIFSTQDPDGYAYEIVEFPKPAANGG